jgi:four helix bundle protein
LKRAEFRGDAALSAQLNQAAISVMNNISERFLRHCDRESCSFCALPPARTAKRSCLYAAEGRTYLTAEEARELIKASEAIGRMIRRLQSTLELPRANRDTKD